LAARIPTREQVGPTAALAARIPTQPQVGPTAGFVPSPQASLPNVAVVGQNGPEVGIVGEYGPEHVVSASPGQPVGFTKLGTVESMLKPGTSGAFPLLTSQEHPSATKGLPAFGQDTGWSKQRLLPTLGAPRFQSAQQRRRTLPSEQAAFQQQVKLTGIPLQDYLFQLQQQLPQFQSRGRLPTFTPRSLPARV
jgi:hypothetical protein